MNANSTKFSPEQIATLKQSFGKFKTLDPLSDTFIKLEKFVNTLTPEMKQHLVDESCPWLATIVQCQQRRATA
jgi:Ca2+-binding EF-hand superfamily protein